jgi:hypothetical protein
MNQTLITGRGRPRPIAAVVGASAVALALSHVGCSNSAPANADAGPMPSTTVVPATMSGTFTSPMDATPDPTGAIIYFTAVDGNGNGAIFSVPASGGAATELFGGTPLVSPFGITISDDGSQLYVADPGADMSSVNGRGAVFNLPSSGGTPTSVSGTEGTLPRGVDFSKSVIYFTNTTDPVNRVSGVSTIPASGGSPTVLASGAPFDDPSGVVVTQSGDVYVLDASAAASHLAAVIKVSGGAATTFASDINVGYPSGITITMDQSQLIVSAIDPTSRTDVVDFINLATNATTTFNDQISTFHESAGLHRARNANVLGWADSTASTMNTQGIVFAITLQ